MSTPKVSILIPLYNSEHYIADTITSAINQTYTNIEVIIVDDESKDNGYSIAKSFESDNVTVYKSINSGACVARNLAFEKSSGEYIQYLDADDLLAPNKIDSQIKLLEKNDNAIASGIWGRFFDDIENVKWENQIINKDYPSPVEWLIDSWSGNGMAQTSIWLTPRQLIQKAGPWNESLSINQDGEFFSRVLMQASSIEYSEEAKVYYRSGNTSSISQSNKSKNKATSLLNSYKLYQKNIELHITNIELRKALGNSFLNFIYQYHYQFPDLSYEAKQQFIALNIGKMWPVGGSLFRKVASVFGFENTLSLKNKFLNYLSSAISTFSF